MPFPPVPWSSKVSSSKDAGDEASEKDQRDLEAQEWMSFLTFWMFIVTTVGVLLLYRTLRETRKATKAAKDTADETRKIGTAQTRAYLSVGRTEISMYNIRDVFAPETADRSTVAMFLNRVTRRPQGLPDEYLFSRKHEYEYAD